MQVTNTARGLRGVNTVGGMVYLDPGETRDLDVPEAEVQGVLDHPDLEVEAIKRTAKK